MRATPAAGPGSPVLARLQVPARLHQSPPRARLQFFSKKMNGRKRNLASSSSRGPGFAAAVAGAPPGLAAAVADAPAGLAERRPHVLPPALHPLYLQVFKPIVWVRAILRSGLDVIGEIRFEIWCLLLEMQSNRYLGTSKLPQH